MLKDVDYKPVYVTGLSEPQEFFLDSLANSIKLDLCLGFFRTSGIRSLAAGFAIFIHNGGKLRLIMNDEMNLDDKEAIIRGEVGYEDEYFDNIISKNIKELFSTLNRSDKIFYNCISWLISHGEIEIKAIVPAKNKRGIAHQKFGIFYDEIGRAHV